MPCMCGDSECPSCGLAQGTLDETEELCAEVELATMRVGSLTAEVAAQRQQISALVAEVERLKREAQPDHAFVPGDPACGWERQCAVVVPVIECGRVVGAHCGRPPGAHALWASARDEEAAAIRAAAKEERR